MKTNPWEEWADIWSTKGKFFSWLRGGIRRGVWNRSPIKLEVIKRKRKRIINPKTGKEIWGGDCYICGKSFPQKDLQVDHIQGEHSLKDFEDIPTFIEAMVRLAEEDLDLVCKPCHSVKSLAERKGISLEEAKVDKEVIAFGKLGVAAQGKRLQQLGLPIGANKRQREEAYRDYLKEVE